MSEKGGRPCLRLLVFLTNWAAWPASPFAGRCSSFERFPDLLLGLEFLQST